MLFKGAVGDFGYFGIAQSTGPHTLLIPLATEETSLIEVNFNEPIVTLERLTSAKSHASLL